jgi:microcystin-dependent protein
MTQTFTSGQVLTAEATNGELAFPTGCMFPYGGSSAPAATVGGVAAWLLCDGTAVSRTTYAALFAVLGSTYGAGNGSTTFNLPDLRGRVPLGAGTGAQNGGSGSGVISGGTALTARTRGGFGGDERLQQHQHTANKGTTHPGDGSGLLFSNTTLNGEIFGGNVLNTTATGSGGNMTPFIVTNYLIKT